MSEIFFALCLAFPGAALLLMIYALVRHQRHRRTGEMGMDEIVPFLVPVNVSTLVEFTNPTQERYLYKNHTRPEFRAIQRKRIRILIEITKRMFHNAGFLQDLGAGQRYSRNSLLVILGEELIGTGVQVRLFALVILLRLYTLRALSLLGPFAFPVQCSDLQKNVISDLMPAYELLKSKATHFTMLKSADFLEILTQNL